MINPLHRLDQADLLLAQRGRRQADLRAAITAAMTRFGFAEVRSHVDAVRATLEAWSLLRGRQDTNLYLAALLSMDKLSKR